MQIGIDHVDIVGFPAFKSVVDGLLSIWPDHERFILRSCADRDSAMLASAERTADLILRLAGSDLAELCAHYRWMCERLREEEVHFRRTGRYRHSSFAEVSRDVYGRPEFMERYVSGLLLSQVVWFNHAAVIDFYIRRFLPETRPSGRLLEIGPGHGLMLCLAASDGRQASLSGWDVSPTSIGLAREALRKLGVVQPVELVATDLLDPSIRDAGFDTVVLSEVLEHLEDPDAALAVVRRVSAPSGRLFVNVPVNSPAPDHIYLLRSPEEVSALIERNGFRIMEAHSYPTGGYTVERSQRLGATISCALIAERREIG